MSVTSGQGVNILLPYALADAFGCHGIVGLVTLTGGSIEIETRQCSLEQIADIGKSAR